MSTVLKYPKKSHRKQISIPSVSEDLAEFLGIEFGDGGIGNPWQVVISLNSKSDAEYAMHIQRLIKRLFSIVSVLRKRPNQNTLVIVCSSMNLVDFLVGKGAVRGNKVLQRIDVPGWIRTNPAYQKAFVRGLVDTDGCLYIHNHVIKGIRYRNIGLCFTSSSKPLVTSTSIILKKFGVEPHITDEHRRIYLYSGDAVSRYLRVFGSSNSRILDKYKEWRGARVA